MSKLTTADDNRDAAGARPASRLPARPIAVAKVEVSALEAFILVAFRAMGVSDEQSQMTAHALVYSELRFHPGQGQGVRRRPGHTAIELQQV